MSLRVKSLLVAAATMTILLVVFLVLTRFIITDSYTRLEQQDTTEHVARAVNALTNELETLSRTDNDYAGWDDTYNFMESRDPVYLESNYVDSVFTNSRLNLAMIIDTQGQVVFAKGFDLEQVQETPLTPETLETILHNQALLLPTRSLSVTTGLVALPTGLMLIAAQPILTSNNTGPTRGALLMGRALTDSEIEQLSHITQLKLAAEPVGKPRSAEAQAAVAQLSTQQPIVVQPVDEQTVQGYTQFDDINGQPAVVLRVDRARTIYQQGQATLSYLVLALALAGVIVGIVLAGMLEHTVILRLDKLNREVQSIGASGDLSKRVSLQGKDELGSLGTAINSTLASLETAERQLYQREREAITLLDNLPAYVFFKDTAGRYVMANQRFCATTHRTHDEIVGKTDYDLYPRDRAERYRADDARVMAHGETVDVGEETLGTAPDEIVLDTHKVPVKDEASRVIGLIGLAFDVTERKHAAQELAMARDQALDALRFKSQLLAHVSHDLRTPINAVLGYAEMLEAGVYGPLAESQRDPLTRVIMSCHQLARLVSDLLSQSRMEAGTLVLNNRPFVLSQLVDSVKAVAGLAAAEKQLALTSHLEADVPAEVAGDFERLHQVVANLVDNAIKFTEQGSIDIHVFRPDAVHYAIAVADTGPGIPLEEQARVFEAFQQGAAPAKGRFKGVGLGLSIVKQFTTLMGGQVSLTSEIGRGSTFTITLPLLAVQEEKA